MEDILLTLLYCVNLLGTTFDFNRLGVTGPPEGLFTGWRRTRTVLPFELHLSDFRACYHCAEQIQAALAP